VSVLVVDDLYAQLVRDSLDVLDRYRAAIGQRDPVKSLDEDPEELLQRLRIALEPLVFKGVEGGADVVEILSRIDEMRARVPDASQSTNTKNSRSLP
jgi:hypothetical protein